MKPNNKDVEEWEELCAALDKMTRKATYCPSRLPNSHLLSQEKIMALMRKYMRENGYELVFWSTGWGWRLRKDWKEKIKKLKEMNNKR